MKLTPAAATSTSSWPGPGLGAGQSLDLRTSGPPCSSTTTARMKPSLRTRAPGNRALDQGAAIQAAIRPGRVRTPPVVVWAPRAQQPYCRALLLAGGIRLAGGFCGSCRWRLRPDGRSSLARGEYPGERRDAQGEKHRDAERDPQPAQGGRRAEEDRTPDHPQVAHAHDAGKAVAGPGRVSRPAGQEDLRGDARQARPQDREPDDAAHRV